MYIFTSYTSISIQHTDNTFQQQAILSKQVKKINESRHVSEVRVMERVDNDIDRRPEADRALL